MICQRCAKEKPGIHTCTPSPLVRELEQQRDELAEALRGMLDSYRRLVNSGDCGFWNPDEDEEVVAAITALAKVKK